MILMFINMVNCKINVSNLSSTFYENLKKIIRVALDPYQIMQARDNEFLAELFAICSAIWCNDKAQTMRIHG